MIQYKYLYTTDSTNIPPVFIYIYQIHLTTKWSIHMFHNSTYCSKWKSINCTDVGILNKWVILYHLLNQFVNTSNMHHHQLSFQISVFQLQLWFTCWLACNNISHLLSVPKV